MQKGKGKLVKKKKSNVQFLDSRDVYASLDLNVLSLELLKCSRWQLVAVYIHKGCETE